jgi:hypothetical protein
VQTGVVVAQRSLNIAPGSGLGRRHHRQGLGQGRQGTFKFGVEQALGGEALAQLAVAQRFEPVATGQHLPHRQLVAAALGINFDGAQHNHLFAEGGLGGEASLLAAPGNAAHGGPGIGVGEGKKQPLGMVIDAGYIPHDPHLAQGRVVF